MQARPFHGENRQQRTLAARCARQRRCATLLSVWFALVLIVLAVLPSAMPLAGAGRQNRAGLIVQTGDGEVITRCVSFAAQHISGLALLERSGLPFESVNNERYGAFICRIAGVGCPADRCLCAYPPRYWQYWLRERSGWRISPVGASGRMVRDGDVDGWVWFDGRDSPAFDERFGNPCEVQAEGRVYLPLVIR